MAATSEVALDSTAAAARDPRTVDFAAVLQRADELGISMGQLAEMAGVDRSTLWRCRKRGKVSALEVVTNLADGLHMSMDEVTGRSKASQ